MRRAWLIAGPALGAALLGCHSARPNLKPTYTEVLAVPPDDARYSQPTKYPAITRDRTLREKDKDLSGVGGGMGAGAPQQLQGAPGPRPGRNY